MTPCQVSHVGKRRWIRGGRLGVPVVSPESDLDSVYRCLTAEKFHWCQVLALESRVCALSGQHNLITIPPGLPPLAPVGSSSAALVAKNVDSSSALIRYVIHSISFPTPPKSHRQDFVPSSDRSIPCYPPLLYIQRQQDKDPHQP